MVHWGGQILCALFVKKPQLAALALHEILMLRQLEVIYERKNCRHSTETELKRTVRAVTYRQQKEGIMLKTTLATQEMWWGEGTGHLSKGRREVRQGSLSLQPRCLECPGPHDVLPLDRAEEFMRHTSVSLIRRQQQSIQALWSCCCFVFFIFKKRTNQIIFLLEF